VSAGRFLFVVASAACGLAPGLGALVAARFAQGAAAVVMMPSSMALTGQGRRTSLLLAGGVALAAAAASLLLQPFAAGSTCQSSRPRRQARGRTPAPRPATLRIRGKERGE
jgi:MFS family permease